MLAASVMGPGQAWRPATTCGQERFQEGPRVGHCAEPALGLTSGSQREREMAGW